MKTESDQPIAIPMRQRLRDFRMNLLPVIIFGAAVAGVWSLWKENVVGPTMVAQAEPVVAHVRSQKPGVLAELAVTRFQRVKAGDHIGHVVVTDPKVLESSLAVIKSEIEMLRVNLRPIASQQRTAMNYNQMRLDWMRDRAQLATSKVNLQLTESEYHRMEELLKDKIVAQRTYDQAKAAWEKSRDEVQELGRLVAEAEKTLQSLQCNTNVPDINQVTADPILASILVQEAKLKLTEAELSPIELTAPMDGIVSMVLFRAGEAVTAGQPIVSIATLNPLRIVGYLRPPIIDEPEVHLKVEVRTRGLRRASAPAEILQVGTQLEQVPVTLLGSVRLTGSELGLPVEISIPANMPIRAGEVVDVIFRTKAK
jgi:multidrug resistance efflux pump